MKPSDGDIPGLEYERQSKKAGPERSLWDRTGPLQVISGLILAVVMFAITIGIQAHSKGGKNMPAAALAVFSPWAMGFEMLLAGVVAWFVLLRRQTVKRTEVFWIVAIPVFGILVAGIGWLYGLVFRH